MFGILGNLLKNLFSLSNATFQILLLILAAVIVIWFVQPKSQSAKAVLKFWIWSFAVVLVYHAFLWLTYCFTMTYAQAARLIAYERYSSTCAMFLLGCGIVFFAKNKKWKPPITAICALLLTVPIVIPIWSSGLNRLFEEWYHVPERIQMQQLYDIRQPSAEEHPVLILPQEATPYLTYMAKYQFMRTDITLIDNAHAEEVPPGTNLYYLFPGCTASPAAGETVRLHD